MRDTDTEQGGALWAAESKWATVNAAAGGANTIVAAPAATRYMLIMEYVLICAADNIITFQDSDGVVLSGPMSIAANGGISAPYCKMGHFKVPLGKGLVLNLNSAQQVGGHIAYALV